MQFLGPILWLGVIPNTPVGRIRTFHGRLLILVLMRPALRRPFGRLEEALKRYTGLTSTDTNSSGNGFTHLRLLRERPFWTTGAKSRLGLGFTPLVWFVLGIASAIGCCFGGCGNAR